MNEQLKQWLTCTICQEKYKQPKLLPCQHTFCLRPCLINAVDFRNKRIICPECRTSHSLPLNGIEAYPDNVKMANYLDSYDSILSNDTSKYYECANCLKKQDNLLKCMDCSKVFCFDCKQMHLIQLKDDIKKNVYELKRVMPKLSEKASLLDRKSSVVEKSFEQIKSDITYIIDTLINELRLREKALHMEADVFMQSQMQEVIAEKENAELAYNNFNNFCDTSELTINKIPHPSENDMVQLKKRLNISKDMMRNFTTGVDPSFNKLKFNAPNMKDLFEVIQKFGKLSVINHSINNTGDAGIQSTEIPNEFLLRPNQQQSETPRIMPQKSSRRRKEWDQHQNISNSDASGLNAPVVPNANSRVSFEKPYKELIPPKLTERNNDNGADYYGEYFIRNTNQLSDSNPFSPTRPNSRPFFGTAVKTTRSNEAERPGSRPIFGGAGGGSGSNGNISRNQDEFQNTNHKKRTTKTSKEPSFIRSDTFELENPTTEWTPQIDNQHNNKPVKRRVKTPVSFNVILDDETSKMHFDQPTSLQQSNTQIQPRIDYGAKSKARIIIGKEKGRENGEFVWPIGISVNQIAKTILISDSNNHRVQIFDENGNFVKTFGSFGSTEGKFNCCGDITTDAMANIYVIDTNNHRIQVFDRYCRYLRKIGSGPGNADGQLNFPWGISVTKFSEIFVTDKENDRICVFHFSGKFLRTFGSHGSKPGQFDKPYYIHVTNENKVIVSDSSNHRIQILNSFGYILHCFGTEGSHQGQLRHPRGIITDSQGFILVADSGNSRIQVFRPDGTFISSFGSEGTDSGRFRGPEGIKVSLNGDILVCDRENHRVQIF